MFLLAVTFDDESLDGGFPLGRGHLLLAGEAGSASTRDGRADRPVMLLPALAGLLDTAAHLLDPSCSQVTYQIPDGALSLSFLRRDREQVEVRSGETVLGSAPPRHLALAFLDGCAEVYGIARTVRDDPGAAPAGETISHCSQLVESYDRLRSLAVGVFPPRVSRRTVCIRAQPAVSAPLRSAG